jgi:acetyl-CoA carboxylase biotin carboxyl carrier protein
MSELTYRDVLRLLKLINASDGINFDFESNGTRIKVERDAFQLPFAEQAAAPSKPGIGTGTNSDAQAKPKTSDTARKTSAKAADFPDATAVNAPMIGVFYAAPEPGRPPFVEVGSKVKQGDQLGIIEVMKLFTSVTAPCDGVVVSILVENQQAVAKDEVLLLLGTR